MSRPSRKRGIRKSDDNVLLRDLGDVVKNLNREELWNVGGYFHAFIYDDGKPLSLLAAIRENIPLSVSSSMAKRSGYGPNWADKGKMLSVFQMRTYPGGGGVGDDSFLEESCDGEVSKGGEKSGMVANVIRQNRKGWNKILWDYGLGKNFMVFLPSGAYTFDESYFASGSFVFDLIPGFGGRGHAIRRKGYLYNPKDGGKEEIAAKIADVPWLVPTKLFGNQDRIIDIYDPRIASDDCIGGLLCGFSKYLSNQRKYVENRCQEAEPEGIGFAGADADAIGNV